MSLLQKEENDEGDEVISMYFTDGDFVISAREITTILVAIVIVPIVLKILYRKIRNVVVNRNDKFEDYPGSIKFTDIYEENKPNANKFSDIADVYIEKDFEKDYLDTGREEKVIFEENISGVSFGYNEKTRVLTIGEKCESKNVVPIEVKLSKFDDLRDFVDRLEDYVNE